VIVDSSALVAILKAEPDRALYAAAITREITRVSASSALETAIVVEKDRFEELDALLADAEISVVPFDAAQARIAREAYAEYGKKSGSRARLNLGDCMTYALAKVTGEALLFKGDGFTHTDLESAL
jgi:ribonuclease VapC